MCARLLLAAAVIALTVCPASGQTTTADGVAALARGDYQQAVEILKPRAEDWRTADPIAQFFMAGLYETGRGVPMDPLRACALYARVVNDGTPFGRLATTLLGVASVPRGEEFIQEYLLLARTGFEHGFEPVTFYLGPGHSVALTLAAATVTYGGEITRVPMAYARPLSRFLPVRYTELATGPTRSVMRHFVEVFAWDPGERSGRWGLRWEIFEVVGDEVLGIRSLDSLVTTDVETPPVSEAFDVREYGVLRVDDEGNAEWAVLKGEWPRIGLIPPKTAKR